MVYNPLTYTHTPKSRWTEKLAHRVEATDRSGCWIEMWCWELQELPLASYVPLSIPTCSYSPGPEVPPVQRLWRMFPCVQLSKRLQPLHHHCHT